MKILVVEDELNLATYLKRGLEEEGHTIELALDSKTAKIHMGSDKFDMVILDIILHSRFDWVVLCNAVDTILQYNSMHKNSLHLQDCPANIILLYDNMLYSFFYIYFFGKVTYAERFFVNGKAFIL